MSPGYKNPINPCKGSTEPYTVVPGDTCWDIAHRNGMSLEDLERLNKPRVDCERLLAGETICLPKQKGKHRKEGEEQNEEESV
jgi:LysM repeat protein